MKKNIIVLIMLFCATLAPTWAIVMNTDFINTTGNVANDYHLKLVCPTPITIDSTFQSGGQVVFDPPTITGNGTNTVSLDFAGATVNNGETTHIGFADIGNFDIKVAESFWTFGGIEILPRLAMATATFNGAAGDFLVARISLYDDMLGSNLIGMMWWEEQAAMADIYNYTTESMYASVSFGRFQDMIQLEDLNESLTGFGPESQIQFYAGVPEPMSLLLTAIGLASLCLIRFAKNISCTK